MLKNLHLVAWCTSGAVHMTVGAILASWAAVAIQTIETPPRKVSIVPEATARTDDDWWERPHGRFRVSDASNDQGHPEGAACEYPKQCRKELTQQRLLAELQAVSIARQPVEPPLPVEFGTPPEVEPETPAPATPQTRPRESIETPLAVIPAPNSALPRAVASKLRPEVVTRAAAPGDAVDRLPRKLDTNPAPAYPPDAFESGQQGLVLLRVRISQRGQVTTISVSKSSGVASLDRAALETVRTWRFEPARRGDKPVSIVVTVPIRFAIQ